MSDLFGDLAQAPTVPNRRNDVRKGDAAEMYVIAKLLSWGYDAHDARRDLPYDVLVDFGPGRICRLQVKCRSHPKNDRWSYRVMRGNWRSATGTYGYETGDYDAAVSRTQSGEGAICAGHRSICKFSHRRVFAGRCRNRKLDKRHNLINAALTTNAINPRH